MSQLFSISEQGLLTPYIPKQAEAYLKQELGIVLQQKKETAMAEAIKTPDAWLTEHNKQINSAVKEAGKSMSEYQAKLLIAGIPSETAKKMALDHASRVFQEEKLIVDLVHPGYGQAFGKLQVDRGKEEGDAVLYGTADITSVDPAIRKAIKHQVIAKYEAKKANKATK